MLENVRGLLDPKFTEYRTSILQRIADLGYRVQIKLLNASDYGVPQLRPRVIIVGIRNNENGEFHYPEEHPENAKTVGETTAGSYESKRLAWRCEMGKGSKQHCPDNCGRFQEARRSGSWTCQGKKGMGRTRWLTDVGVANEAPAKDFEGMPRLTPR